MWLFSGIWGSKRLLTAWDTLSQLLSSTVNNLLIVNEDFRTLLYLHSLISPVYLKFIFSKPEHNSCSIVASLFQRASKINLM